MIYGSVCSGIEAATVAWHPLGWTPAFFSEIEPFPSAVLAYHYPTVPNLGDMTKFKEWGDYAIDVLVGGTPCQSFSVAGLRKGLADPRGNLTLTFLAIAEKYQPQFIVWENVPGIISDKTNALGNFMDGLEELGYVVDIDIIDAQFCGVPQRRRRVFICAQKASHILKARTITSALTITQCLAECLLLTLAVLSDRSKLASENCGFDVTQPDHSLQRRMKLFGMDSAGAAQKLADNLAVIQPSFEQEQKGLVLGRGSEICASFVDTKLRNSMVHAEFQNTDKSLNNILEDALLVMNGCITSTCVSGTTESKIYSCAKALLRIAKPITQSMDSSPSFWSAASSSLIAMREFTDYARSASSDLFTELEWIQPWSDFIEQAEQTIDAIGDIGIECFGEIFPVSESLSGNPPPRREARENVAPTISARTKGGGGLGTDFECDGGLQPVISKCLVAGGATTDRRRDGDADSYHRGRLRCRWHIAIIRQGGWQRNATGCRSWVACRSLSAC